MSECPCPREIQHLGRLYGISMGDGVVRVATDPGCRIHNDHAFVGETEGTCTYCGIQCQAWIHPETRDQL